MPSHQKSQVQEGYRYYFDFVRDFDIDGGDVSLQAVHIVNTAKRYAAAYGDTEDVLMREAAQKYRAAEQRGREYKFFGAIINQLKYPLSEEVTKHMERKERKRRRPLK